MKKKGTTGGHNSLYDLSAQVVERRRRRKGKKSGVLGVPRGVSAAERTRTGLVRMDLDNLDVRTASFSSKKSGYDCQFRKWQVRLTNKVEWWLLSFVRYVPFEMSFAPFVLYICGMVFLGLGGVLLLAGVRLESYDLRLGWWFVYVAALFYLFLILNLFISALWVFLRRFVIGVRINYYLAGLNFDATVCIMFMVIVGVSQIPPVLVNSRLRFFVTRVSAWVAIAFFIQLLVRMYVKDMVLSWKGNKIWPMIRSTTEAEALFFRLYTHSRRGKDYQYRLAKVRMAEARGRAHRHDALLHIDFYTMQSISNPKALSSVLRESSEYASEGEPTFAALDRVAGECMTVLGPKDTASITVGDMLAVMDEKAGEVAKRLFAPQGSTHVTRTDVREALRAHVSNRQSLAETIAGKSDLTRNLTTFAQIFLWALAVIALVLLLEINYTVVIFPAATFGLSLSFVFSNALRMLFEGLLFNVTVAAFERGERIQSNAMPGQTLIVQRVGLLTTEALAPDGRLFCVPNSKLNQEIVTNMTRSPSFSLDLGYYFDASKVTPPLLSELRLLIHEWFADDSIEFGTQWVAGDLSSWIFQTSEVFDGSGRCVVRVWVGLSGQSWGNALSYIMPRSRLNNAIITFCKELGLSVAQQHVALEKKGDESSGMEETSY